MTGTTTTLSDLAAAIGNGTENLLNSPPEVLQTAFDSLNTKAESAAPTIQAIGTALEGIATSVPSLSSLVDKVGGLLNDLPAGLSSRLADTLSDIVQTLATAASNPELSTSIASITTALQNVLAPLEGLENFEDIQANLGDLAADLEAAINEFYTQIADAVNSDAVANLIEQLGTNLRNLAQNITDFVTDLSNEIQEALSSALGGILDEFQDAINAGVQDLQTVPSGVSSTIDNTLSQLGGIKTAATTALSAAKTLLSPFASALTAFGLQARATLAELTNFSNSLNTIANSTISIVQTAGSSVLSQLNQQLRTIIGDLVHFAQVVNSTFANAIATETVVAKNIICTVQTVVDITAALSGLRVKFEACVALGLSNAFTTALLDLAKQFNLASTVGDSIGDCVTAYNSNGNALTGAACLITVGVNAATGSTAIASNTILTTLRAQLAVITNLIPTCVAESWAPVKAVLANFETCVNN